MSFPSRRQSIFDSTPRKQEADDEKTPAKERRADKVPDRALCLIEAILTYVEANAIDHDGVWMDEDSEEICEEFIRLYIDEGKDVDPPSFNAKHPHFRISQFPNIVRTYIVKYSNPMIPSAAMQSIQIISMPPNALTTESGEVIPITQDHVPDGEKKRLERRKSSLKAGGGEDSAEHRAASRLETEGMTSTTLKFGQAQRVVSFMTPLEHAMFGRLLIHIAAMHHRACFNGLAWRAMGSAFSFLMRALSPDQEKCAHFAAKTLEFFVTNVDSLLDRKCLKMLGDASGNEEYGSKRLSLLARETAQGTAKFRLFPGSPAAMLMKQVRRKSIILRRKSVYDHAAMMKLNWVGP